MCPGEVVSAVTSPGLLLAAERAVRRASELMREGRSHVGAVIPKGDRDFATVVDVAVEEVIRAELGRSTPGIPFLGEEEGGVGADAEAVWVLDPIDGTANFAKESPLCGVSLALLERSIATLGLIELPFLGERYVAARGRGAFLNGRRIAVAEVATLGEAMVGFADFSVGWDATRENAMHLELMRRLSVEVLRIRVHGSAALDLAWLAAGRLNATVMLSNLAWDVSAGVVLVREAGGLVYDSDGSDHTPRSLHTVASAAGLSRALAPVVREVTGR